MRLKLGLISLGLFILALGTAGTFVIWKLNQPVAAFGKIEFLISSGESVQEIGENLQETEVMNSYLFVSYVRFKNLTSKIQAGKYEIPLTLTPIQVVALLQHGTFDTRLTFLEGWRREQYLEYALSKLAVDDEVFSAEFLEETEGWEGYLFPDTYSVSISTTAKNLVAKLRVNFDKKYSENILPLEVGGLSKSQIVILASLLERESVGDSEELKTIAGILIKRWKSGWRLDVDATVQYVLGRQWNAEKERWEWWKDSITATDKNIDSPYNTYKYAGLPPGPISSPGLETLLATVDRRDSPYWFYLHCKDGQVRYAETLEKQVVNRSCLE